MGLFAATTEGERAAVAATAETMMELMGAAAVYAKLVEACFSFDGQLSTDAPVVIELYQITATGTGTAATEVDLEQAGGTANVAVKYNDTVEPTKGSRIGIWEVHPQGGSLLWQLPLGVRPAICRYSTAQGLAFVVTAPANVNYVGYCWWEE